jgi:hypothetical protein
VHFPVLNKRQRKCSGYTVFRDGEADGDSKGDRDCEGDGDGEGYVKN